MKILRIVTLVVLLLVLMVPAMVQASHTWGGEGIGWNDPDSYHESFVVMDLVKGCCSTAWFVF